MHVFPIWQAPSREKSSAEQKANDRNLILNLERAMKDDQMPPELLQRLLNLAEFMERADKPIGIAWSTLGHQAQRCNAYAKALHYVEIELDGSYTPRSFRTRAPSQPEHRAPMAAQARLPPLSERFH